MDGVGWVLAAAVFLVGTHFLLSHPLRKPLVGAIGEGGFIGLYSVIALGAVFWVSKAYQAAPATEPLWPVGNGLWALVTLLMLVASVMLMGSVVRNPALPGASRSAEGPAEARGVFAITRHPMMWAFALWGLCHIIVYPIAANIVIASAIIVLALVGAALQDRKKEVLQPVVWRAWEAKTSYWPFAAVAAGRAKLGGFGMHALAGGTVVWLAATWAHMPLAGWAAGIWRWI